jgi:hypothetical protein
LRQLAEFLAIGERFGARHSGEHGGDEHKNATGLIMASSSIVLGRR